MQKLLKAQYFMKEMREYEIKSFSKTFEFNPNLPKTRFLIIKNTICIKIMEHVPRMAKTNSHTISCTKFSKE